MLDTSDFDGMMTSVKVGNYSSAEISTSLLHHLTEMPFIILEAYWRMLAGAFAVAAARIRFPMAERSYLAAAVFGTLFAALLVWSAVLLLRDGLRFFVGADL